MLDNIYFAGVHANGEMGLYKINEDNDVFMKKYMYEDDSSHMTPLYYTDLSNKKESENYYYERNGFENINEAATNPKIVRYKKVFFLKYVCENFWEIFCFSLNNSDCSPRLRAAEYIIKIQLRNQNLTLRSEGFSKYPNLTIYYKKDPKTDDFILVGKGNSLWRISNKAKYGD